MIPRGNAAASSSSTDSTSEVTASVSLSQSVCLLSPPPVSIFCHLEPFPLLPAPFGLGSKFGATGAREQGLGAFAPWSGLKHLAHWCAFLQEGFVHLLSWKNLHNVLFFLFVVYTPPSTLCERAASCADRSAPFVTLAILPPPPPPPPPCGGGVAARFPPPPPPPCGGSVPDGMPMSQLAV
jgi:hypothetical protein